MGRTTLSRMGTDTDYRAAADFACDTAGKADPADVNDRDQTCLFCGNALEIELLEGPEALCTRCGSPLARASRQRPERSSRRVLRRVEQLSPVRVLPDYSVAEAVDGMMQNLSLNGMRFESPAALEPDQLIRVDSALCRALGRVTHCTQTASGAYSTGVEFVTVLFAATDSAGDTR